MLISSEDSIIPNRVFLVGVSIAGIGGYFPDSQIFIQPDHPSQEAIKKVFMKRRKKVMSAIKVMSVSEMSWDDYEIFKGEDIDGF